MKITFLTAEEARDYFSKPDEYAKKLSAVDLNIMVPENPTLEAYQEVLLSSFEDFSDSSKENLEQDAKLLDFLDFEIKLVKTTGRSHRLDMPQTRRDAIFTGGYSLSTVVFVHEVFHVISRKHPTLTDALSKLWGFERIDNQIVEAPVLLNPDAPNLNYSMKITSGGKKSSKTMEVVPFLDGTTSGLVTKLKVLGPNPERILSPDRTDYPSKIPNTRYFSHPEEICAEHFSLVLAGNCIFEKSPLDLPALDRFKSTLETKLKDLGLVNPSTQIPFFSNYSDYQLGNFHQKPRKKRKS